MTDFLARTRLLIGDDALLRLKNSHVALFGAGGVGSYVFEALTRAGVGEISIFDNDIVTESNINRQLIALNSTLNMPKVEAAKNRAKDINPNIKINAYQMFFSKENSADIDFSKFDFIVDAIDSVSSKIELVLVANKFNIPIICSMGTGNKLDPSLFMVSDIYKTKVCPLARVMRYELKKRGIKKLKVVYSPENPIKKPSKSGEKPPPASISFVPPAAGLILAGYVVSKLIEN